MKTQLMFLFLLASSLLLGSCSESSPVDTDSDTDSESETDTYPIEITDLSWYLHKEIGAMVYVTWHQSKAGTVHVEFQVDDEWNSTPTYEAEAGTQEQLVVGIPFASTAQWRVVPDEQEGVDGATITTADIPEGLPLASVELSDPDNWYQPGKYLLTSINQYTGGWTGGTYWTFIIDRQARPVWALKTPLSNWTLFSQVAVSGDHILVDEASLWSQMDSGASSKVHFRYLDAEFSVMDTPGLHHAFVQLPDGTLAWGSQDHGGGEALVEKALEANDETILWTCEDDWEGSGWNCESNGLFYVEATNSFLYSFYTNDSLVEVDRATGESLWWAGEVEGGYSFDPPESQFNWQHGISYTDEGTLLLSSRAGQNTPVYEYNVDHDNQTLELIWSYDPNIHAQTNGDAWRLDNGNTLHLLGSAGHIIEVDEDGEELWHLDFDGTRLLGRGEFIEDLHTLITPR